MTIHRPNIPIAPSAPTKHKIAFRRCRRLESEDRVKLISDHNPWRTDGLGYHLFESVLRPRQNQEMTVAEVQDIAERYQYPRPETERHLRWLYTWGDFLELNGMMFFRKSEVEQI